MVFKKMQFWVVKKKQFCAVNTVVKKGQFLVVIMVVEKGQF